MKIAIISVIHEPWGGSEELWAALAQNALESGHQVAYSTYNFKKEAPRVSKLKENGLLLFPRRAYVPGSAIAIKRKLAKMVHFLLDIVTNPYQRIFKWNPDIIIYNGTSTSIADDSLLQKMWNKFHGTRCILAHFIPENNVVLGYDQRRLVRQFFAKAHKLFFVSDRTAMVTERTLALKFNNYYLLRNPVNLANTAMLPYPPIDGKKYFAIVGNLIAVHKGQDVMLQVLGNNTWKHKDWHLNIYGDGMDRQYLEELTGNLGLKERITFHGRVQDIRKVWENNHLLLMPSVMEGMPLAVVEAMLCGRPVLVTDVGGHAEWVEDGVSGFLASAPGLNALHEGLSRLWNATEQWAEMGRIAHERALQLFDPNAGLTFLHYLESTIKEPKKIS
jgi:glycosyltransferase involved in cell wall biosynthesis